MRLHLLLCIFVLGQTKKLPDIYWNSTNPLVERFAAIGDTLDIYCPHYGPDVHPADTEQVVIYRVPERDYESCRLSSEAEELRRCTRPYEKERWTASFRTFSPSPSALHYKAGQTYYFISTSTGSAAGLHNTVGGLCASHNLKMIIHVTDRNGDISGHHRKHHSHSHHAHHHRTTTSPTTTKSNSIYEWNNPLWEKFLDKLSQDKGETYGKREPTRGERVALDDAFEDEKNAYEALPLQETETFQFEIHEIGDVEGFHSSSSTFQTTASLLLFLLFRI